MWLPDPCETCGATATCAHYAPDGPWSDAYLNPTELKAARANERN